MRLNLIISIVDRSSGTAMQQICTDLGLRMVFSELCRGTAKAEDLALHALQATPKTCVCAVANDENRDEVFKAAIRQLKIDIPGNGIIVSVPIKSIGGGTALSYLSENNAPSQGAAAGEYAHELIVVVASEGYTDQIMDSARMAGAGGGTVFRAAGTGQKGSTRFFAVNLASEKEVIYIVASAANKASIMKAIAQDCGPGSDAGAICFTLPIESVMGLREI